MYLLPNFFSIFGSPCCTQIRSFNSKIQTNAQKTYCIKVFVYKQSDINIQILKFRILRTLQERIILSDLGLALTRKVCLKLPMRFPKISLLISKLCFRNTSKRYQNNIVSSMLEKLQILFNSVPKALKKDLSF